MARPDRSEISRGFADHYPRLRELKLEVKHILAVSEDFCSIKASSIESRIKSENLIVEKFSRHEEYVSLFDLCDLVGIRIIVPVKSDMKRTDTVLCAMFDVISVDEKSLSSDGLGYLSTHYVCKLKKEYSGPRYDGIKPYQFEIQVRTICMHAWSALSHHLQYKSEKDVPLELRQSMNALSGLFYVADNEFEHFVLEKEQYNKNIDIDVPSDVPLNMDTLRKYLDQNYPKRMDTVSELSLSGLIDDLTRIQCEHNR